MGGVHHHISKEGNFYAIWHGRSASPHLQSNALYPEGLSTSRLLREAFSSLARLSIRQEFFVARRGER